MKAISFLGTAPYKPTIYCYGAKAKETAYFAETLPCFFPDVEQVLVLLTPTVQQHNNWAQVQARLGDLVQPVPIPEGRAETELWEIFNALTEAVGEGETVIFDITHSFRSLPFLTFLAAAYLRTARQVKVHKIVYGAFDAKDAENRSPVFDLTPFVGLLDWITATNQFIYTGDGRYLAHLLKSNDLFQHPQRRLTPEEREAEVVSKRIRSAALAIDDATAAILTSLIPHAEQASWNLIERLEQTADDLSVIAPPYRLLAERVSTTYAPLAQKYPMAQDIAADLRVQLAMLRWYLDKGHIPQAGTLMREWLISAVGYRLGLEGEILLDNKGPRGEIERALGWLVQKQMEAIGDTSPPTWVTEICTWPESTALVMLWSEVADWRNLINHGAIRKNWSETPVKTVLAKGEKFYTTLLTLAHAWELTETGV